MKSTKYKVIDLDSNDTETKSFEYFEKPLPKTKESSILDFTYLSLSQLEDEVTRTFPNEECAECSFHLDLLGALSFCFINNGWEKKELLEMFAEMVDESIDNLVEFEKEEVT